MRTNYCLWQLYGVAAVAGVGNAGAGGADRHNGTNRVEAFFYIYGPGEPPRRPVINRPCLLRMAVQLRRTEYGAVQPDHPGALRPRPEQRPKIDIKDKTITITNEMLCDVLRGRHERGIGLHRHFHRLRIHFLVGCGQHERHRRQLQRPRFSSKRHGCRMRNSRDFAHRLFCRRYLRRNPRIETANLSSTSPRPAAALPPFPNPRPGR